MNLPDILQLYTELQGFVNKTNKQRYKYCKKLSEKIPGFKIYEEQIPGTEFNNLILEKKGKLEELIVVGAHYDKAIFNGNKIYKNGKFIKMGPIGKGTDGIIDNASSVIAILNSAKRISHLNLNYSYHFVLFGAEERTYKGDPGKTGSRHYLKESKKKPKVMINIDPLGIGTNVIMTTPSDKKLTQIAQQVAKKNKIFLGEWDAVYESDHIPFEKENIPILYIEADKNCEGVEHTIHDQIKNVNFKLIQDIILIIPQIIKKIDRLKF